MSRSTVRRLLLGSCLLLSLRSARAEHPIQIPSDHTMERAGYPSCTSRFAAPPLNHRYQVGYVGGGSLFCSEGRCPDEGTFGKDYVGGGYFLRKVFLGWNHGTQYQAGRGAYKTDAKYPPVPAPIKKL